MRNFKNDDYDDYLELNIFPDFFQQYISDEEILKTYKFARRNMFSISIPSGDYDSHDENFYKLAMSEILDDDFKASTKLEKFIELAEKY